MRRSEISDLMFGSLPAVAGEIGNTMAAVANLNGIALGIESAGIWLIGVCQLRSCK